MLKPQTACREVVRQVQALFRLKGLGRVKNGSAYCQARLRLPRERLERALAQMAQHADQRVSEGGRLRERPVKVVDGTTVQLADTRNNQKRYPQLPHQKPGCGFPEKFSKVVDGGGCEKGILRERKETCHHHKMAAQPTGYLWNRRM
jgi:hypothetical protein